MLCELTLRVEAPDALSDSDIADTWSIDLSSSSDLSGVLRDFGSAVTSERRRTETLELTIRNGTIDEVILALERWLLVIVSTNLTIGITNRSSSAVFTIRSRGDVSPALRALESSLTRGPGGGSQGWP
jgi:hypothetical protein